MAESDSEPSLNRGLTPAYDQIISFFVTGFSKYSFTKFNKYSSSSVEHEIVSSIFS